MQEKSGIWDKIMHFFGFWLSFGEEYRPDSMPGQWTKLFGSGGAEHRTKRDFCFKMQKSERIEKKNLHISIEKQYLCTADVWCVNFCRIELILYRTMNQN